MEGEVEVEEVTIAQVEAEVEAIATALVEVGVEEIAVVLMGQAETAAVEEQ